MDGQQTLKIGNSLLRLFYKSYKDHSLSVEHMRETFESLQHIKKNALEIISKGFEEERILIDLEYLIISIDETYDDFNEYSVRMFYL